MKTVTGTIFVLILAWFAQLALAGGAQEKESVDRGEYIVAKGRIIPPQEIYEDAYVSALDFQYPDPREGTFAVRFLSGNRQVSTDGQEEVILIGIQGSNSHRDPGKKIYLRGPPGHEPGLRDR